MNPSKLIEIKNIKISSEALTIKNFLIKTRRDFHKHPELGNKEFRSSIIIADHLKKFGLEVKTKIATTGVMGILRGGKKGKTILIRADMDALPIEEKTNLPFKSKNKGLSHACAHDGHMAILLGLAKILSKRRKDICGNIKFIFQPDEEFMGGAERMIKAGVLKNPKVDMAIGYHIWNYLPLGKISIPNGPIFANSGEFYIDILGKSAHACSPELGTDAIKIGTELILALNNIISTEISSKESAVVHVGTLKAGDIANVVAEKMCISGTIRTFDMRIRKKIIERIKQITRNIVTCHGGKFKIRFNTGYPEVVNNPQIVKKIIVASQKIISNKNISLSKRTMGSEDMSFFFQKVPGAYFFIGGSTKIKNQPQHSSKFDFDERAMMVGVEILRQLIENEVMNKAQRTKFK